MNKKTKTSLSLDQKYDFYEESVQNTENEIEFVSTEFSRLRKREARVLREDFCGTGKMMVEWADCGEDYFSYGVDLDPEPIDLGKKRHLAKVSEKTQQRVQYILGDVLKTKTPSADIVVAFNFSYFIFKKRAQLKTYFTQVYEALKDDGVFFLDIFGGPESQTVMEESTEYDDFTYYWDCDYFDAITNHCQFYIHFKPKKGKKVERVFSYDWRFWFIPELREILEEVGFKKTIVYWEGDDDDSDGGNGEFLPTESEENCLSWVCYIAALK